MATDSATKASIIEAQDRKRTRDLFRVESARKWLICNPGEPVAACVRATGIGESKAQALAREIGHRVDRTPMGVRRAR